MLPALFAMSLLIARQSNVELPVGSAPAPVVFRHFPDRLHAFVWRNWSLVPAERMADVVGARKEDILAVGRAMGLPNPPTITADRMARSYLTVIRRNWHLLPYDQLLKLLRWTPEHMAYTLREDDFLWVKLGNLKPKCDPIRYSPPDEKTRAREAEIARIVHEEFPNGLTEGADPIFGFVKSLSKHPATTEHQTPSTQHPRFCYSYFALYGDPLLDTKLDPYPDGLLNRLAERGVNGVWLQGVLYKLAPFPWDPQLSDHYVERLANLRKLVARAKRHGISIYLYLNEPRAMPLAFFKDRPEMKGVVEGDWAALCTSDLAVRKYLADSVESICRAVPDLGGFFTITASENLTNCWSHHQGAQCPQCGPRGPAEVIAEVNATFAEGIRRAQTGATLFAWDWGWTDESAPGIIARLPAEAWLMSVSEWSLPIERGGVKNTVGEYSISSIGPGPRAMKHWELARRRGLKTIAKVQAGCTWELSTVPYIPALENVARHAANLSAAGVDGIMLGWTLGGYPSPNLEVFAGAGGEEGTKGRGEEGSVAVALERVAETRVGKELAPALVRMWTACSKAFSEYPYDGAVVYNSPVQLGPANLLWDMPTRYQATMVGFPYDDLDAWRGPYPAEIFAAQYEKMADGFNAAVATARAAAKPTPALESEIRLAEACAIHFRSVANQARFVLAMRAPNHAPPIGLVRGELNLAKRLYRLQQQDSRLGFEASNQYAYIPLDLVEKVLNCRDLLDRWLRAERNRQAP
jgi:hypothetical protein